MSELHSISPLPAVFKIINGERVWTCGTGGCKGKLATVRCLTGEEDEEGEFRGQLFLILPNGFTPRADGVYQRSQRSAKRSDYGKYRLAVVQTSVLPV